MIWLTKIAAFFFDTMIGKVAAGLALAGILIGGFALDQRKKERRNVVAEFNQSAGVLVTKGRAAADAVPDDGGNWGRLRKYYCGDC